MSPVLAHGMAEYEDSDYDVYALLDAVPRVVSELERPGERFRALLSAFLGVGSLSAPFDSEFRQ